MKSLILFFAITCAGWLCAQESSKIVVYSEEGDSFTLKLNGKLYTEEPVTNVEIDEVEQTRLAAVVEFKDKSKGVLHEDLYAEPGQEAVYRIKMNRRGRYKINLYSTRPLPPDDFVHEPGEVSKPGWYKDDIGGVPEEDEDAEEIEGKSGSDREKKREGDDGNTKKVKFTRPDGSESGVSIQKEERREYREGDLDRGKKRRGSRDGKRKERGDKRGDNDKEEDHPVYVPGYTGKIGCPHPISGSEIDDIVKSVQSQSFSDSKMKTAKRALRNSCIRVSHTARILPEFSFDNSKIEFAKFAYDRTHDIDNFYQLYDQFGFSSSVDEIEEYIEKR